MKLIKTHRNETHEIDCKWCKTMITIFTFNDWSANTCNWMKISLIVCRHCTTVRHHLLYDASEYSLSYNETRVGYPRFNFDTAAYVDAMLEDSHQVHTFPWGFTSFYVFHEFYMSRDRNKEWNITLSK